MSSLSDLPTLLEASYRRLAVSGRSVLLAVSGGADSMALLHATCSLDNFRPSRIEVASLDHGLRPESRGEIESVAAQCRTLAVAFHTELLNVGAGAGLEARARRLRYEALERIRASRKLDFIATAHTASDQAETLLMRLARGSSTRGLASIHERQNRLIRPMLDMTRTQVEQYLQEHSIEAAVDVMNSDEAFFRVQVRRQILPRLESATGPQVSRRLGRAARLFAEDDAFLSLWAQESLVRVKDSEDVLDVGAVNALAMPIRRRVLAFFLENQGVPVNLDLLEGALNALQGGSTATLARDRLLEVRQGTARVIDAPPRSRRPVEK